MPDGMRAALKFLPFAYELYFPVAVLMEKVRGTELWVGLAIQAGWVIACFRGGAA